MESHDPQPSLTPEGPSRLRVNVGYRRFRACSACEGDYEDPERTAWRESEEERRARDEAKRDAAGEPASDED